MSPSDKPKNQKAPGAPKRFKSSFILFFMDVQKSIKKSIPSGTPSSAAEVSKRASRMWKLISAEERKHWDGEAAKEKIRYEKEKESYQGPWKVVKKRVKKDPTAPKRNSSAFLLYSVEKRKLLKKQHSTLKNTDISRLLGIEWRKAADIEKRPFILKEIDDRNAYKLRMEKWKKEKEESLRCNSRNGSIPDKDQASSGLRTKDLSQNAIGETCGVTQSPSLPNLQKKTNTDVENKTKRNFRNDNVTNEPQGPNENEKKNFVPRQISSGELLFEPSIGLINLPSKFPSLLESTYTREILTNISDSDGSEGRKSLSQEDNDSLSSVQMLNKDSAISNLTFASTWNSSSSAKNPSVMHRPGKLEALRTSEDDSLMGMISQSNSRPSSGLSIEDKESIEWQKWLDIDSPEEIQPGTLHVSPLNSSNSGGIHYMHSTPAMKRNTNKNPGLVAATVDSFPLPTYGQIGLRSTMVSESVAPYVVSPGRYGQSNRSLSPLPYQNKQWYPHTSSDYQGRYGSDYQGRYSTHRVPQTPQHMRSHYLTPSGDNRLLYNNVGMMDISFAPINEEQNHYLPVQFDLTGPLDDFDPNIFEK